MNELVAVSHRTKRYHKIFGFTEWVGTRVANSCCSKRGFRNYMRRWEVPKNYRPCKHCYREESNNPIESPSLFAGSDGIGNLAMVARAVAWELSVSRSDGEIYVIIDRLPDAEGKSREPLQRKLEEDKVCRFTAWVLGELIEERGRLYPKTRGWLYVKGMVKGG